MAQQRDYSEKTAQDIDVEIRKLVEAAHEEAYAALTLNRDILDAMAKELMEKETLQQEEIAKIFAKVKKVPKRPTWLSSKGRPVHKKGPIPVPKKAVTDATATAAKASKPKASSSRASKPKAPRTTRATTKE